MNAFARETYPRRPTLQPPDGRLFWVLAGMNIATSPYNTVLSINVLLRSRDPVLESRQD